MRVIAYITDGHEAANLGIAFGLFVLAYIVGLSSYLSDPGLRPVRRRLRKAGLAFSGFIALRGFGMGAVWLTRSNLIFRGDRPSAEATAPPVAPSVPAATGSSSDSSSDASSPSSGSSNDFCSTHTCIGAFYSEPGYIVECGDGTYSHAGGLSGACSHHGGEASGPISTGSSTGSSSGPPSSSSSPAPVASVSTPTVPTYQPPPSPPASLPRLTGATSATSNGFSFSVKSLVAEKDLDQAGSPPSFGVGVIASCTEPDTSITTWDLSSGGPSYDSGTASCFQGSINPEGMAVTMTVIGCGPHVLTVTPMGFGDKVDGILRPQAAPLHFPFRVCQ